MAAYMPQAKTVEWETPQNLFDKLNEEFVFNLDVCATPENAKCKKYYTITDNGLNQPWKGICWMNPPYGLAIKQWIRKAWEQARNGVIIVSLLPVRTDTKWFHEYIYNQHEIRLLKGRLKFGKQKNSATFPSMIVIFRGGQCLK